MQTDCFAANRDTNGSAVLCVSEYVVFISGELWLMGVVQSTGESMKPMGIGVTIDE